VTLTPPAQTRFSREREGPRRNRAGEGEVGTAPNFLIGPLILPCPPGNRPAGEEGKKSC